MFISRKKYKNMLWKAWVKGRDVERERVGLLGLLPPEPKEPSLPPLPITKKMLERGSA